MAFLSLLRPDRGKDRDISIVEPIRKSLEEATGFGHSGRAAVTAVATGAEVHDRIPPLVDNIAPAVEKARKEQAALEHV
ncbi:MAG: hypothetical protein GVY16_01900 [Planctomycetes bacterium]|jgi:hypothetical protein|nr:hypothetical protein [Planctomycetota bacterium]